MIQAIKSDYWRASRTHIFGFLFALPLWVGYELLTLRINHGWGGEYRTGTDYLLKKGFELISLPPWLLCVAILTCLTVFFFRNKKKLNLPKRKPFYFGIMFLESMLYGSLLGLAVGSFMTIFLSERIAINEERVRELIINLGSGVYEELIFRLILLTLLVVAFKKLMRGHQFIVYLNAIIISSLLFSLYHYMDIFSEPYTTQSFVFRFLAGVLFSVIFIFRGYGIAAYSHSFYNIFLLFRS